MSPTPAQARCTHSHTVEEWIEDDEDCSGGGHWKSTTVRTTEDIDTGRSRCTRCGLVMYYTGLWRQHWEGK